MPEPGYFNTTNSAGAELVEFKTKANSQEAKILEYFETPGWPFGRTPSEIRERVFANAVPLTSVRRAMTNLTNAGKLEKTKRQSIGPYGRPEYAWKLYKPAPKQRNLFE